MSGPDRLGIAADAAVPVVAAVILRDGDGRILLARRGSGGPHAGLWEFPGGKVEPGETPQEALVREIREELGLEIDVEEEVACVVHAYPHGWIRLTAWRCRIIRGIPEPIQCSQLAWVEPSDLPAYPMPRADVPIALRLAGLTRDVAPRARGSEQPTE